MPSRTLLATAGVALAAVLVVGGCTSTGTSSADSTASTTVTASPGDAPGSTTPGAGEATAAAGGSGDSGATGAGSTGGGSSGGSSGTKPTTGAPTPSGPVITYFRVAQKPSCPAGTNVNPIPGTPVVVEWKATNVDSVALSVDGPGVYGDSYAPAGSETLNFPCSGGAGDIQRHTYLLTVRNAQGKQTRTLVVSAVVNEIPTV